MIYVSLSTIPQRIKKLYKSVDSLLKHVRSMDEKAEVMRQSGLFIDTERGYIDRFRGRIMFSIADSSGKIVAFAGRVFESDEPAKYVNSPETPIYSKSKTLFALSHARAEIRKQDLAILVEGYLDCIALHQVGINNVVASCGTSLTDHQAKLLGRFTKKVIVNFDPDQAGKNAALRSINILLENMSLTPQ